MEYESHGRPWWEYLKFYTMFIAIVASSLWMIYVWKGDGGMKTNDGVNVDFAVSRDSNEDPKTVLIPFLRAIEGGDLRGAMESVTSDGKAAIFAKLRGMDKNALDDFEDEFRLAMAQKGGFSAADRYEIAGRMKIELSKSEGAWKISRLDY